MRLDDLTGRVDRLETSVAQTIGQVQVTLVDHAGRTDRIERRIARIDKWLDVVDA